VIHKYASLILSASPSITLVEKSKQPHRACSSGGSQGVLAVSPLTTVPSASFAKNNGGGLGNRSVSSSSTQISHGKRALLTDMKKPFGHLKPKTLMISTVRVTCMQGGMAFTSYLGEQLETELAREELVTQGKLTPEEADREADEWEKREWKIRITSLPNRILKALLKFHASTLFMRLFEHLCLHILFPNNIRMVDRLTKDPFCSAQRKSLRCGGDNIAAGKQMYKTAMYSNAISFLADYTVHQCILFGLYSSYYYRLRCQTKNARRAGAGANAADEDTTSASSNNGESKEEGNEEEEQQGAAAAMQEDKLPSFLKNDQDAATKAAGGLFLSFCFKSSSLMVSRATALVFSCGGASVGTMIYPGWGTVVGTQLGDGLVGAFLDAYA